MGGFVDSLWCDIRTVPLPLPCELFIMGLNGPSCGVVFFFPDTFSKIMNSLN